MTITADIARVRKEMEMETDKLERQKENLSTKLQQTEKDLQLSLKAEQHSHEEDNERLATEKVRGTSSLRGQKTQISF